MTARQQGRTTTISSQEARLKGQQPMIASLCPARELGSSSPRNCVLCGAPAGPHSPDTSMDLLSWAAAVTGPPPPVDQTLLMMRGVASQWEIKTSPDLAPLFIHQIFTAIKWTVQRVSFQTDSPCFFYAAEAMAHWDSQERIKNLAKRRLIAKEIIATERTYVQQLTDIVEVTTSTDGSMVVTLIFPPNTS